MNSYNFQITDNSDIFKVAMDAAADEIAEAIGIQAQSHTIENIRAAGRVDTGLMANSVAYAVGGKSAVPESYKADRTSDSGTYSGTAPQDGPGEKTVYDGSNLEYFAYQELGFRLPSGAHVAPMNALKRGVEQAGSEAERIARSIMETAPEG